MNPPKPPELRERRNKTVTATTLTTPAESAIPPMPEKQGEWHARTRKWWLRVWSSPMASQYIETDLDGLERLCDLIEDRHRATSPTARRELDAEIRLQQQSFGLTQLDRHRLQWIVPRQNPTPAEPAKPPEKRPDRIADPRSVIMAVK